MIRYKSKDYARALLDAIEAKPAKRDEILRNFVLTVARHRYFPKWREIVEIFEKLYMRESGEKFIDVYLARENRRYRDKVLKSIPHKANVTFHLDPSLIGGLKILINREILIDGSVRRRIAKLFTK